jgi:hypothetical protein
MKKYVRTLRRFAIYTAIVSAVLFVTYSAGRHYGYEDGFDRGLRTQAVENNFNNGQAKAYLEQALKCLQGKQDGRAVPAVYRGSH